MGILGYCTLVAPSTEVGQGGVEVWIAKAVLIAPHLVYAIVAEHKMLFVWAHTIFGVLEICVAQALDAHTYKLQQLIQW